MAKTSGSKDKDVYTATDVFKKVVTNKGLLTDAQYKKLVKGEAVNLKGVPDKQMRYLVANNLIKN